MEVFETSNCSVDHFSPHLLKGLENYWEHRHRLKRAKLARRSKPSRKLKLLGVQTVKADVSGKNCGKKILSRKRRHFVPKYGLDPGTASLKLQMEEKHRAAVSLKLQREEKHRVIKLTDVTILPKVGGQGGETDAGTLEAHVKGFVYRASSFSMHFLFNNIKASLIRLGEKGMAPLLHFHLYYPIKMGTEKTRDIQFHLVECPMTQKRSDHGSDKNDNEKQIRDGGRNNDLKSFIVKVSHRWTSLELDNFSEKIEEKYEFNGVLPSKAPVAFALTLFSLVVLVEPFIVVPLRDIEIVNLALLRHGEIDMTVIYRDFKEDKVLEISSIP